MTDATSDEKPKAKRVRNPTTPSTKGRTFTKLRLPDSLTIQEEGYARARAIGMSQLEAMALITGGKTTSRGAGSHYEKKPHVKARIDQLRHELTERAVEKASVDRAWVLSRLKKVADRCLQEEPVMVRGEPTGEYKFDSAGANRALELLGKELGMFVERKQIDMNPLGQMSDDDLMRMAAELAQQTGMAEVIDVEAKLLTNGEPLRDTSGNA